MPSISCCGISPEKIGKLPTQIVIWGMETSLQTEQDVIMPSRQERRRQEMQRQESRQLISQALEISWILTFDVQWISPHDGEHIYVKGAPDTGRTG